MSIIFNINVGNDPILITEITKLITETGIEIYDRYLRRRGIPHLDIIVALGSAGAFTALYQVICKYLEKNKDREITIEREGTKICIKGHSVPEEKEFLKTFAIESMKEVHHRKTDQGRTKLTDY